MAELKSELLFEMNCEFDGWQEVGATPYGTRVTDFSVPWFQQVLAPISR